MENWPVNPADIAVIIVVIGSALLALANGLVRSVLSLAGWIGAAFTTFWSFDLVRPYARNLIGEPTLADVVGASAVFLVALIVFTLVAAAAGNAIRRSSLSALDRTLGFVFGIGRGVVLMAVAYMGLSAAVPPKEHPPWIARARSMPVVEQTANWLKGFAPPEVRNRLGPTASDSERQQQQARDADRALRALTTPRAQNPNPTPNETGYKAEDRRGLERLLQANEPAAPPAR